MVAKLLVYQEDLKL